MPLTPETGHLLTASEVADMLKVSRWTVSRLVATGALPVVQLSTNLRRYRKDDVEALIESQRLPRS